MALATVLTALFLTTSFSLSKVGVWLKKPLAEDGMVGQWMARMKDWRDEKESKQLKKRVEEIKIAGRPPVAEQRVSKKESVSAVAELDEDEEEDEAPLKSSSRVPAIIKFRDEEPPAREEKTSRAAEDLARQDELQIAAHFPARPRRARRENGRGRTERTRSRHRTEVRGV